MKSQSGHNPGIMVKSNGKTQVNYNIISKEVTDEYGTRTIWEYDYVEIEGNVTKQKVFEAMQKSDVESDTFEIVPDNISTRYNDTRNELVLSTITNMTYNQLNAYIDANVIDLASARMYLKKLSRVVLAILKRSE